MKSLFLFLTFASCLHGEILRLSMVVENPGSGITRHEFGEDEAKQTVFVRDQSFITERDVEFAIPSVSREDSVDITLTVAGAKKMKAATAPMRPGVDRIAIVVNGKLMSAPVVQSVPLGKNFQINGLKEKDEALKFASILSGKSEEEMEAYVADEKERIANLPKPPPPVYHTDEEYHQLAAERGKMGLNLMDRPYTEEELDKLLSPGMILADVTGIFGKARHVSRKDDGGWETTFETAAEKFPFEKKYRMDSFIAVFRDGKFVSWRSFGWSERPREPKPRKGEPKPTNLIIKIPPADMSSESFDFVRFVEGYEISLKPGETELTDSDVWSLANALVSLATSSTEGRTIDSTCDVFSILASKIPELKTLEKKSEGGKVSLTALKEALDPYVSGEKQLP